MFTMIINYLKSVFATIFVLYLSFASPSEFRKLPSVQIPYADKFVHFAMFLILGSALCYDFFRAHRHTPYSPYKSLAICVLYPIILGAVIEIAQKTWFYPRSAEWLDWIADMLGVIVAFLFFLLLKHKGVRI